MTPRERLKSSIDESRGSGMSCAFADAADSRGETDRVLRLDREEAARCGAAAGHAFRALEIMYDREQFALAYGRQACEDIALRDEYLTDTVRLNIKALLTCEKQQNRIDLAMAMGQAACERIAELEEGLANAQFRTSKLAVLLAERRLP